MSELEHYNDDMRSIAREIMRAALVAGIDLNDTHAIRNLLDHPVEHADTPQQRARERLRGLLFLRDKLETEELRDMASGMHLPR